MRLTQEQRALIESMPRFDIVNNAEHLVTVDSVTILDTGRTIVIITPKTFEEEGESD